jgi:DNA-binding NarL/FixJ family response regulator
MNRRRRITVMVADDHAGMLKVVSSLLEQHFDVVAVASNGNDLIKAAINACPDVIVADICMPPEDGVGCMLTLKHLGIEVPFVLMSTQTMGAANLLELGAAAYVHKYDIFGDLVKAVELAVVGKTFVSRSVVN